VLVESDAGTIAIAPPADSIGSFVVPCPGMGIGEQHRFEDTSQTFLVNRIHLQIPGKKMYLESTGEFRSEFYMFSLDNKFGIVFISGSQRVSRSSRIPKKWNYGSRCSQR
jgi:hypothetical protein